jgi:MarR family 2-MHQ and catechol resistance regulon transcriptional repressor
VTARSGGALRLWLGLARAYSAVSSHAAAQAARHGLSLGELAVLDELAREGKLLLGELQRRVFVSSGGATFLVDRLERKGLVRRKQCPDDRRATYACLTAKGSRLFTRVAPDHAEVLRRAVAGLSPAQQRTAVALLSALENGASSRPAEDTTR